MTTNIEFTFREFKMTYEEYVDHAQWDEPQSVWGINKDNDWEVIDIDDGTDDDAVLKLIAKAAVAGVRKEAMLVLLGWGAPEKEGRPSKHPKRLRMRILIHIKDGVMRQAVEAPSNPLEVIVDNVNMGKMGDLLEYAIVREKELILEEESCN